MAKYSKRDSKMLKAIKNLLKRNKTEEKDNDKLGCICYNLLDTGEIEVKINLNNLETDSIEKFAKLFARVTTLNLSGYTIQLTKELFMKIDEEKYVQMMLFATEECNKIIEENDITEDEYIKPSEMFND